MLSIALHTPFVIDALQTAHAKAYSVDQATKRV
jgi:hypothetical protein